MKRRTWTAAIVVSAALVSWSWAPSSVRAAEPDAAPFPVGMAKTMIAGVPTFFVDILDERLGALMKEFAGLNGKLEVGGTPLDLARKLKEDKVRLGIFQGVEFAWVRTKHPELRPLMLLLSANTTDLHAQVVVRKNSGIKSLTDLRGKDLACPKKAKVHCRIFLEGACAKMGGYRPDDFFNCILPANAAENALDDLLAEECHAVLADQHDVQFYERLKPGHFSRLQVLETSVAFPTSVIAYREGALSDAMLERLRQALLRASKSQRGQDIMSLWQITAFVPVHEEYPRSLEEIVTRYPPTALDK